MKKLIKTILVFACGWYLGCRLADRNKAKNDKKEEFDRLNEDLKKLFDEAASEGKDIKVYNFQRQVLRDWFCTFPLLFRRGLHVFVMLVSLSVRRWIFEMALKAQKYEKYLPTFIFKNGLLPTFFRAFEFLRYTKNSKSPFWPKKVGFLPAFEKFLATKKALF